MIAFAILLAAIPQTAPVKPPAAPCPASIEYAPPFDGWQAAKAAAAPVIGAAVDIAPTPVADAKFASPADRAAKPGTGVVVAGFDVAKPGVYRIAIGGATSRPKGIWIDIVANGAALKSIAHQEGFVCGNISKVVDFDLAAGHYALQLTGIPAAANPVRVLILPRS